MEAKNILDLLSGDGANSEYRHLKNKKVTMMGVCAKEGQTEEGPEIAPAALRKANLGGIIKKMGWDVQDLDDLTNENVEKVAKTVPEETEEVDTASSEKNTRKVTDLKGKPYQVKHGETIGKMCGVLHKITKKTAKEGNFMLTLGGDHGIATGSISGLLAAYPDLRLIWVDAHGDINTPETSPSGNYHGMPVAHVTGIFSNVEGFEWLANYLPPERLVFIGLRDIDPEERLIIKNNKIKYFSMHEVDRYGIGTVMETALKYLDPENKNFPIHVSFDIDSVDPQYAIGTGTQARGGLTYREAHYIMRRLAETGNVVGLDMVEINPVKDPKYNRQVLHGDDPEIEGTETVCLGIELIRSLLGHTLL